MKVDLEYIYDTNNAKVWSIELNKNIITIKFGKKGSILRIIKSTFKTEKEAIN